MRPAPTASPRPAAGSLGGRPRSRLVRTLAAAAAVLTAGGAAAGEGHGGHPALGRLALHASCGERAQAGLDVALAWLHHMTYPAARKAFEEVAAGEPGCAMAWWGVAMTYFQPLWPTRPGPEELARGWEAVERAKRSGAPTERERRLVAAAEAFFLEPAAPDYWLRIRRWEAAMEAAHRASPDDDETATFFALAHLAAAPPEAVRAHADRAAEILLGVYARNPQHPGAMHYLVHANDVPGRERELLAVTRAYEALAPRNPHALHMPTHIYTRLGDWDGVIRGNLLAAEAALEQPAGDHGEWVWDELPHAIEYLVYAYLQKGDDAAARRQIDRLASTPNLQPSFKTAFHRASIPARFALERRAWPEAAALAPASSGGGSAFAWAETIAQFARGLGAAHEKRLVEATSAVERIAALEASAVAAGEDVFARNIRLLRLELTAWIAERRGEGETALAALREACALEAATPKPAVTPGPTLPALELLGDLLLERGQPQQALAAYEQSLDRYPHRLNSLVGAARAARASGDPTLARHFYRDLVEQAGGGDRVAVLDEARSALESP